MSKFNLKVEGSVGQVGDNSTAVNMNVSGSGLNLTVGYIQVSAELEGLRAAALSTLDGRSPSPEEQADLIALEDAQRKAKKGDGVGVLDATKKFGGWLMGIAKDIGVKLAVEVLKGKLGLP